MKLNDISTQHFPHSVDNTGEFFSKHIDILKK